MTSPDMSAPSPRPASFAAAITQAGNAYPGSGSYAGESPIAAFIRYALSLIRRNIWLIAGIVAGMMALAVAITVLDTPRYTATTSVQINDQSEQVLGDRFDTPSANLSWDIERFLNTQVDILRSRGLAARVARKLALAEDASFFAAMETDPPEPDTAKSAVEERVVSLLMANTRIDLPQSTRIAMISFNSTDAAMSAKIANTIAEEFIQSSLQRRYDSSAYARTFVTERLEEARLRLESSERELNAYAREAGLIRTRGTNSNAENQNAGSVTAASLMQLNEAANNAQASRVAAEGRWNAEKATPLLSSQAVLANPTVQALMTKRSNLASELQDARSRYLSDHPAVTRLEGELASLDRQLEVVGGQVRESIRSEYNGALAAEQSLRQQVRNLQGATLAEQDLSVRYNTLAREADTNRSLYEGLLQRYRELNAAAGISASNIAIIDKADPPLAPSSPNLLYNLIIGTVLGLGIAGSMVFLRDQLDDRIRVPEDVEGKVGVPLLGVVPLENDVGPVPALDDPRSPVTEAYNSLRGSLFYSTPDGLPGVLLVTSAQASEGKTTSSLAVARSMALAGKRTLLIDADLRRPSVHRMTGVDNTRGLTTLLTSRELAKDVIQLSEYANLSLMPSGPIPPSPTELLSSARMATILEDVSRTYDIVIIDSAPVLGLADSPVLSAIVDGVMLVVEADRGRGGSLKAAIRRLRAMNPVLLGAVLTKFDAAHAGNRYSQYYGYEYFRYSREDKDET